MNYNELITAQRYNRSQTIGQYSRNEFQRDYDRLIFSAAFRRMQNKTQVFPLPRRIFVHNRLTHSLEVSSVGRSLGSMVALALKEHLYEHAEFDVSAIVSAACLAHDMGNPPFGHFGENAISEFFLNEAGTVYKNQLSEAEWKDFTKFDGNANTFRILTHQFHGRREGGFALTYSTLASVVKYPFEAVCATKQKFGFFQSEKAFFEQIAEASNLQRVSTQPLQYARHPFVYLVEAADDICYGLMDVEDAHKLGLLSTEEVKEMFLAFFEGEERQKILQRIEVVTDDNEQIGAMRAIIINKLVTECADIFVKNIDNLLAGEPLKSLIETLPASLGRAMTHIQTISINRIYNSKPVADIEVAGYKILLSLMEEFSYAIMNDHKKYAQKLLQRVPQQYLERQTTPYGKLQNVVDFVTSMTDIYALNLYKIIKGIELPSFI